MRCKQVRDMLLSGYTDKALDERQSARVREHLVSCEQCRAFEAELVSQRALFKQARPQPVPDEVWIKVRDAIITEQARPQPERTPGVVERLRAFFLGPRPVFAAASLITVLVLISVFVGPRFIARNAGINGNGTEIAAEYGVSVESEELMYSLGTDIEEYFLS